MTAAQRIYLMADLWPAACEAQGWSPGDRAKRLEVLGEALGRPVPTASAIGDRNDFDAVKAHLKMLANDLVGAYETVQPEMGRARRLWAKIREQIKCIALYRPNAEAYVSGIIQDKFNHGSRTPSLGLEDLTATPIRLRDGRQIPSQLDQLVMTLASRLNNNGTGTGMRIAAGDSVHTMLVRAGLRCDCAACRHAKLPDPDPHQLNSRPPVSAVQDLVRD